MDVVLFCYGDNFKEYLHWEPKLGVFVALVELDDVANGVGVTLFKTVETLRVPLILHKANILWY